MLASLVFDCSVRLIFAGWFPHDDCSAGAYRCMGSGINGMGRVLIVGSRASPKCCHVTPRIRRARSLRCVPAFPMPVSALLEGCRQGPAPAGEFPGAGIGPRTARWARDRHRSRWTHRRSVSSRRSPHQRGDHPCTRCPLATASTRWSMRWRGAASSSTCSISA